MFTQLLPSFADELMKLAYAKADMEDLVNKHHSAEKSKKNWPLFEKHLKNKKFVSAVMSHPASDDKLKRYTQANYEKLKSKNVVAKVKSRSEKRKMHKIVALPSGRLACDCRDWQYMHSHKGTDCEHIKGLKNQTAKGHAKTAVVGPLIHGTFEGVHRFHTLKKAKEEYERGLLAQQQVQAAKAGKPALLPEG